jgi:hypothetical protein
MHGFAALRAAPLEGFNCEVLSPLPESQEDADSQDPRYPWSVGRDHAHHGRQEETASEEGGGTDSTPGSAAGDGPHEGVGRGESKEDQSAGEGHGQGSIALGSRRRFGHQLWVGKKKRVSDSFVILNISAVATPGAAPPAHVAHGPGRMYLPGGQAQDGTVVIEDSIEAIGFT